MLELYLSYYGHVRLLFGLRPIKFGRVRSFATVKSHSREGAGIYQPKSREAQRASHTRGQGRLSEPPAVGGASVSLPQSGEPRREPRIWGC
ncbi:hypothetical protein CRG98_046632 [Punica granatum]|uniref:Uncharacterized protein n=1 Tax=Punica granatum TaxID=22663 RepID=A0A2I0HMP9_PUNGR|nr:hypothetical protein CRG98_046632 [Punica granatum]